MINGLCDFVDNIFPLETTSLSSLVVTGLAEVEIQLFTWPSHNLRWFVTLNYQSAKYGGCKPCGSKDIIEVGRKVAYDYLIRKVRQISFVYFVDMFHIAKSNKVILLQSVKGCYYEVRQVLQSVTVITKWDVTVFHPLLTT